VRQPAASISTWVMGRKKMPPMLRPVVARAKASLLFRLEPFGQGG
jgi:hypothetical protein